MPQSATFCLHLPQNREQNREKNDERLLDSVSDEDSVELRCRGRMDVRIIIWSKVT